MSIDRTETEIAGAQRAAEDPILTPAIAARERAARTSTHVRNCVLMAVVTSPAIAAKLIDQAIELQAASRKSIGIAMHAPV